ncbi:MAG: Na/Pi cotransporter family protein [Candidatus Omnitrophica bacterium]|nr:Na/Pi cotransporter family protein [Candidatus Omnitrophota bacterium]
MVKDFIFYILGGLGFFFFGMQIMSEGLKKLAGERLKAILNMVTKLPVVGVLVGTAVTCLIQSSSATTVMVVGFVNAGLLALKQAIAVVMGANIGTTFTAWLVSSMSVFKITHYALPFVGAGFAIKAFGRTKNVKFWGQVIMGFGILFIGLSFMRDAFGPLRDSQYVRDILVTFCHNPLLGVLVGIIITVLLQSSSATIAIVQVLAFNGLLSFPAAVPIILGDNIGTTITAQLASAGTSVNARRTAMAHSIFNIIGVSYMMIFVYNGWFVKWINFIIPGEMTLKGIMFYIAVSHSFFNIANTLIFLPFINWLEKLCIFLVPKKKGAIEPGPQYLEKHLLNTPTIAIEQARREIARMLNIASKSVSSAIKSFLDSDLSQIKQISEMEQMVDGLQSAITEYLVDISQNSLSDEESESLPVLIHSVNDAERIGDHAENIVEFAERRAGEKLPFTDDAMKEINLMWNELRSMMTEAESALLNNNYDMAESVLSREKNINRLQVDLKKSHVDRLNEGKCNIKSGIIFLDLVDNMEKIGDHLTNIAQGVLEEMRWKAQKEHAGFKKTAFN